MKKSSSMGPAIVAVATLLVGCATATTPGPATSLDTAAMPADTATQSLLASACYDCHSNRESVPWYGTLAPSYWFSGKALKALNFSAWQSYDARQRQEELDAIVKTVDSGEMPPRDYALLVSSARLTTEQRRTISEWAKRGDR
jgi:hypothetical protein